MLYVILQRDVDPSALCRVVAARGIRQWLYLGEESAWRIQAESAIASSARRVSIGNLLDEISWKLRQSYIDRIGELSTLNECPEWWASELAAKNPYSNLYLRICLLGVARRLMTAGLDSNTLIVCSTPALLDEVFRFASGMGVEMVRLRSPLGFRTPRTIYKAGKRYAGSACRHLVRFAQSMGLFRFPASREWHPAYRRRVLVEKGATPEGDFSGEDAILLFTWIDRRNFTADGRYRDPHLGPLPELLRERGYRVAYVPRVLPMVPFAEMVDRLFQTGERLFFPELYVSDQDRKNCYRRAAAFAPLLPPDLLVCDIPVHRLAREHLEMSRTTLAETLTYECLIATLSARGVHPRQIIHTYEGHSWEQILTWSVRQHMPTTRVTGYDNVNFSRMALSMYPAGCEYGLRPLPDRIVTNGPLYREVLLAENIPSSLVKVGCGLRHAYLWDLPVALSRHGSGQNKARVLVATAIGFDDAVELVTKAVQAFGGDARYEIVVKCHPMVDEAEVKRYLASLTGHENVSFIQTPIGEVLPSVHVMLYTYSAVCYEALQHGVPPVFVKMENFLNLDQLEATPDVRWEATTADDLRHVASQIMQMTAAEYREWRRRASEVVRLALAPITPECVDVFVM